VNRGRSVATFLFGAGFCAAILILAVFYPNPSMELAFILRVVLAVAVAAVGSVIFDAIWPGQNRTRGAGGLAIAGLVYFANPQLLLSDLLDKKASNSVAEGKYLLSRANYTQALERFREAQQESSSPRADVSFYLGVIEEANGHLSSAIAYFRTAREIGRRSKYAPATVSDADISFELGYSEAEEGDYSQAVDDYKECLNAKSPNRWLAQDAAFELGKVSLQLALQKADPLRFKEALGWLRQAQKPSWPHQQAEIWGNYFASCALMGLEQSSSNDIERRSSHVAQVEAADAFDKQVSGLQGQRLYEFQVISALVINRPHSEWPSLPIKCQSQIDLTRYFPRYVE
jgi:tetratricopeptide (TPR) repeat protein